MRPTVFQKAEIRDENDVIVQQGTYGKGSALSNSTNDGWVDYVMNNLEFLYGLAKDEVVPVSALPASGDMNKTYLLTTTGVCYRWDGTAWVEISSSEAVGRAETAANLAEQWATKTDGVVADNEYSAKYYANAAQQSADDAQDVADDMADHLAQIDQNTGGVSANSKRIGNIEKLLQGNLYDYDTDDDTAYAKSVPAGAMPYAGLEKLGGKTVVMNQLNDNNAASTTVSDVVFTNNGDGSWSVSGLASADVGMVVSTSRFHTYVGHKYLIRGCPAGGSTDTYYMSINGYFSINNFEIGSGRVVSCTQDLVGGFLQIRIRSGENVNLVYKPQCFDLTLMFGSGNEPSTVAEFEAMFPASYYAYNAGTLLSAGVTSVVSKDTNNATLQTIPIPTAIRNLEGYGWSAGTAYNYVDFERKVFVKNVGAVDMGTLEWYYNGSNFYVPFPYATYNCKYSVAGGIGALCAKYNTISPHNVEELHASDKAITVNNSYLISNPHIFIMDSAYSDVASFQTAISGTYLLYELQTFEVVDINEYLTDDNLIQVDSGGTLTFENQHGTDYQIPVPSTEEYMIDLQEALS